MIIIAVYSFYISSEADGRKSKIEGGTRIKDGSQTTHIYQRKEGEIIEPFTIKQYSIHHEDGCHYLITEVYHNGKVSDRHVTEY